MTPKEKAKELVDKYYNLESEGDKGGWITKNYAKQYALITCDEVLGYMGADRGTEFWLKVKQEIKKL